MKGIIRKLSKSDLDRIKKYTDDFLNSVEKEIETRNSNLNCPYKVGDCLICDFDEYISIAKIVNLLIDILNLEFYHTISSFSPPISGICSDNMVTTVI